jgi:putative redox protein
MQANITWLQDIAFSASADSSLESGYQVMIDGPPAIGGQNKGCRPMEMVLFGLGSCAAVDLVTILTKQKFILKEFNIVIDAERTESVPKVFTAINLQFNLTFDTAATELDTAAINKIERATALSVEKYCSVYAMLHTTAKITHEVVCKGS